MLAKIALGCLGAATLAGVYSFHEGAARVSVNEYREKGAHLHLIVPAALVSAGLRFAPERELDRAAAEAGPWLPAVRALTRELEKFPDTELVRVDDGAQHVSVTSRSGKLEINVRTEEETMHVSCPLTSLEKVAWELEARHRRTSL